MTLGTLISKYRSRAKLSTEELAAKFPAKRKKIEYWEADRLIPSDSEMQRLIQLLKIPEKEGQNLFVVQRSVSTLENTSMMLLFMTMAVLLGYFLPLYENMNAMAFLFTPKVNLGTYIIPYISLWIHFISCIIIIVIMLLFFLKAKYRQQLNYYKMLVYPISIGFISLLFFIIDKFQAAYVGYFSILLITFAMGLYYIFSTRKMYKLQILTKGVK
ncbi:Predicted transcriptional regulator [Alteracholeplasma palmae J233]|uniref:Predicted transcriptional regulator n=1 Tax=Alteracholeplasma palmae (strain ATCC 49389 / J233) TaxID=1318466 RepID=U4KL82_ALTPJ|nr:transcriptional regulator [Alteracholeplasma palmae]CCV64518.1 Predicted transcriptional regulator [Alteracholeplasma palmae J233]